MQQQYSIHLYKKSLQKIKCNNTPPFPISWCTMKTDVHIIF